MNETKITEIKSALMAIKFGIDKGFIKFEDVEDSINEMIEELKKLEAIENLNTILKRIKEGGEQEQSNNSENIDENSQIMQNDLIFTSAGELLNTTNKK